METRKTTDYQKFTTIDMPVEERRKLNVGDIWANEARCKKCGDIVRSKNQHDLRRCSCGGIFVDGGSWYARRGGDINSIENRIVMYEELEELEELS